MTGTMPIQRKYANIRMDDAGSSAPRSGAVLECIRRNLVANRDKTFAKVLGLSVGGARKKLSGERSISLDEFIELLDTGIGFELFMAATSESEAPWLRVVRPMMVMAMKQMEATAAARDFERSIEKATGARDCIEESLSRGSDILCSSSGRLAHLAGRPRTKRIAGRA